MALSRNVKNKLKLLYGVSWNTMTLYQLLCHFTLNIVFYES